jgi:hypothetical protein
MRDLLSKLDNLLIETALNPKNPKGDYQAKSKALDDLDKEGKTDKSAIQQRRLDLDKEAKSKGIKEDVYFEVGDEFGISFSEDFEISTEIVGIAEDGIVIELDETALSYLSEQGFTFEEGELVEEKQKGVDGKVCWKGYKRMGTKMKGGKRVDNCVKIKEDDDVEESGLQYYTGKKKYGKDGMAALAKAGREGASEEELGRIKDKFKKEDQDLEEKSFPFAGKKVGHKEGPAGHLKGKDKRPARAGDLVGGESIDNEAEGSYTTEKQILTRIRQIMYDRKLSGTESNAGELHKLKQQLKDIRSQQGVSEGIFHVDTKKEDMNMFDDLDEAKYQGREVPLGKPMAGDVKKSKVYVRGPKGNVVKVNFGDKKMRIKKSNPNRRKSFRARHNCKNPGPRWKARYWSCRAW